MSYQEITITKTFVVTFVVLSLSFFAFNVFVACGSKDVKPAPVEPLKPIVPPLVKVPLSWEKNHEERYVWSDALFKKIDEKFDSLNKAKDLPLFCPKYASLTDDKKKIVLAELWVWTAYYESGWNPKSSSVDVGTKNDPSSHSDGLWQVSANDQRNWKIPTKYTHKDLLTVNPNIDLSLNILSLQIEKQGLIAVTKNLYWAVLGPKNYRYTKLNKIQSKVKALEFCN
jgi:hypothetical protein